MKSTVAKGFCTILGLIGLFVFPIGFVGYNPNHPSDMFAYLLCFGYIAMPVGFALALMIHHYTPTPKKTKRKKAKTKSKKKSNKSTQPKKRTQTTPATSKRKKKEGTPK